jgi:peptide/nickel transport system substrate-binding protein
LKLWEENVKLVLRKTLYFMKRRERKCTALSRSAITFYRISKVVFQFIQGKLDFTSGLDPSYKDDILTQTGEYSPNTKKLTNHRTYLNTEWVSDGRRQQSRIRLTHSSSDELRFRPPKMITYLRNNNYSKRNHSNRLTAIMLKDTTIAKEKAKVGQ